MGRCTVFDKDLAPTGLEHTLMRASNCAYSSCGRHEDLPMFSRHDRTVEPGILGQANKPFTGSLRGSTDNDWFVRGLEGDYPLEITLLIAGSQRNDS